MKMIFAEKAAYVIEKPRQSRGAQSDFGTLQTLETLADTSGFARAAVIGTIRNRKNFSRRVETYPSSGPLNYIYWDGCVAVSQTDIILPAEMGTRIGPAIQDCLSYYLEQGHPTEDVSIWASYRQGTQGGNHDFGAPFAARIHFDQSIRNMLAPAGIQKHIMFTMSNCQGTVFYNRPFFLGRNCLETTSTENLLDEVTHQLTVQADPASILPTKNFDIVCSDGIAVHKQNIGPVAQERFFLQLSFMKEPPYYDLKKAEFLNNPALERYISRHRLG